MRRGSVPLKRRGCGWGAPRSALHLRANDGRFEHLATGDEPLHLARDPAVTLPHFQAEQVQPHAGGRVYVNFLGEEGDNRVRQAYGARNYERLVELKRAYDPTNFFRLNQNIEP